MLKFFEYIKYRNNIKQSDKELGSNDSIVIFLKEPC